MTDDISDLMRPLWPIIRRTVREAVAEFAEDFGPRLSVAQARADFQATQISEHRFHTGNILNSPDGINDANFCLLDQLCELYVGRHVEQSTTH